MTITLRSAVAADAASLSQLARDSFVAKFGHLYTPENLRNFLAESHNEGKTAKEIANPAMRVMLAEREGVLLGYCKLVMACGWPEHARGANVIELKQLYTAPDATGQGIGAVLMDWALTEAAQFAADEVQLSVYSENPGAQRFYARYGFGKVADIYFMVGDHRDDEFLFAKMV